MDDDEAIMAGLVAWLDERSPSSTHSVASYEAPAAGFSSKTMLVDVERTSAGSTRIERTVLKLPPTGPAIFDRYDFGLQATVQEAVSAAGIPAPTPATAENDERWLGAKFLAMPLIEGKIPGPSPAFDRLFTEAHPDDNAAFHAAFFDTMADINLIDWRAAGLDGVVPRRNNTAELAYWRSYLAWYGDGEALVPKLVEALDHCERHRPSEEPAAALLWGDARLENMILDDDRSLLAVLDWEMATIGAPEHDLAWILTLDAAMETMTGRTVPGFLDRDGCIARYEARLGRKVQDFRWYEILAMVRSTAIFSRISHLDHQRGEPVYFPLTDNPMLDLITQWIDEESP